MTKNREKEDRDTDLIPDSEWFTMPEAEWRTAQLEKLKKPYVPPEHPEELEEGSA